MFPKGEYIIRAGELADEMYFIVSGYCKVVTEDGHELAVLKHGQNFGEMALLKQDAPKRGASVISITKISLAVLTLSNFKLIC